MIDITELQTGDTVEVTLRLVVGPSTWANERDLLSPRTGNKVLTLEVGRMLDIQDLRYIPKIRLDSAAARDGFNATMDGVSRGACPQCHSDVIDKFSGGSSCTGCTYTVVPY